VTLLIDWEWTLADEPHDLPRLFQRIRDGSEEAVREFVERYGRYVLTVIRRRLDEKLRRLFDSQDFMQDVWASFFNDPPVPEKFDSPEKLLSYLARLARNKVIDTARQRQGTRKHNERRERSLDGSFFVEAGLAPAPEPSPSDIALANEQWDRLARGTPDLHQRILVLLRHGYNPEDIARQLDMHPRAVRRVLEAFSARLRL
jgi:RNA polymerase sigma factor (sigma-70 family)